jgi:hypothetical protein
MSCSYRPSLPRAGATGHIVVGIRSACDQLRGTPPMSSIMSDDESSFESASVAAVLAQRSREDRRELLDELVTMLAEVIPGVQVERALLRRHVKSIRLPLGGYIYQLKRNPDDTFEASRMQEVRGVVIRGDRLEIDAFLAELGLALDVELKRTERGRDALRKWLR